MKRVSMKAIAVAAGVSRPTVSRALSGDPQISKAMTERIQQLATEMGYRRDPAFEVLARERWGEAGGGYRDTIGFLLHADLHRDGYIQGARECAKRLGYGLDAIDMGAYPSANAIERVLHARNIRGLILPIFSEVFPVPALDWKRFVVVCCSVDSLHLPFPVVRTNVSRKVELAWEECRRRGYRRIGIVLSGKAENELHRRRVASALYCLSTLPESERVPMWTNSLDSVIDFGEWLEKHRPDAVIAEAPWFCEALDALAARSGRALPHCCLVYSANRAHLSSRPERLGYVAMSLLHQQLVENNVGPQDDPLTVMVEPEWVDGPTMDREAKGKW